MCVAVDPDVHVCAAGAKDEVSAIEAAEGKAMWSCHCNLKDCLMSETSVNHW